VSEHTPAPGPLRVVVLTCAGLGHETAAALDKVPGVEVVAVLDSPHRSLTVRRKLRKLWRARGLAGLILHAVGRLLRIMTSRFGRVSDPCRDIPNVPFPVIPVTDFHAPEALDQLRRLEPDLGVVDGTYILKPSVYSVPRHGCINLHCGRVPDYRGAPPAFWELYDGVAEVGVTVHQITEQLDEGPVFMEQSLRLDIAPPGDPVHYIEAFWRTTLRPRGIGLLKQTVAAFRDGCARPIPQPSSRAHTHRFPTRHDVRELRRRVRRRRRNRD
jgi:methionyl-tRNA formyltransferase